MNLTQQRWRLLAVSCLINLFAGSIYAWSVFGSALAARLTDLTGAAVTGADLALAFGIANGLGPVPMIFGGAVNDRFGPRFVIMAGGLLMGLGLFLTGSVETPAGVVLSYGLFFGLGLGLVYGCTINNTMKFFPDRRGLVGGLTTAAYGISSVLVPPVASLLIAKTGVSSALQIFGVLFGVVIVTGGFLSMRCPPGFVPDGWTPPAGRAAGGVERNWRAMLASSEFPPMIVLLMCGAIAAMMVIAHVFTIARDQMAWSARPKRAPPSRSSPWRTPSGAFSQDRSRTVSDGSPRSRSGFFSRLRVSPPWLLRGRKRARSFTRDSSPWDFRSGPSWGSFRAIPRKSSGRATIPSISGSCSRAFRRRGSRGRSSWDPCARRASTIPSAISRVA